MGKVQVVVDKLRVDKSRVRLAEVQVGDETGSISLRARDSQIDELETLFSVLRKLHSALKITYKQKQPLRSSSTKNYVGSQKGAVLKDKENNTDTGV